MYALGCTALLLALVFTTANASGVPRINLDDAAAAPNRFRLRGTRRHLEAERGRRKLTYQSLTLEACDSNNAHADGTGSLKLSDEQIVTNNPKQRWEWQNPSGATTTDEVNERKICGGTCTDGATASESCLAVETCDYTSGASVGLHGCTEEVSTCAAVMKWEIVAWDPACKCTRRGLQRGIYLPIALKNTGSYMCLTGSLTQVPCDKDDPAQRFYYNTDRSIRFRVDGTYKCLTMP